MKRTQIQLPDWLFDVAYDVAARKEISLAELVRRGLEYMVAVTPEVEGAHKKWQLPDSHALESEDPFMEDNWRESLHTERLKVADNQEQYITGGEK